MYVLGNIIFWLLKLGIKYLCICKNRFLLIDIIYESAVLPVIFESREKLISVRKGCNWQNVTFIFTREHRACWQLIANTSGARSGRLPATNYRMPSIKCELTRTRYAQAAIYLAYSLCHWQLHQLFTVMEAPQLYLQHPRFTVLVNYDKLLCTKWNYYED